MVVSLYLYFCKKEKWHTIRRNLLMMYHLKNQGVLHSVTGGSDKSKLDSLLKYLIKFK